jgi:hypothetical protein
MPLLSMLTLLAAMNAPQGAIEATIRGTAQPLQVELLLRDPAEEWTEVAHRRLPADTRRVRFESLASGVYQLRLRGAEPTEQLAAKIVVGTTDVRRTTLTIEPFVVTGRATLGGTELGEGAIVLRHAELHWSAPIALAADGTFRATLWQRGAFQYSVRSPALPTDYRSDAELDGTPLHIDIPDGRIRGIVRDAKSGAPVDGAMVTLQTKLEQREELAKLTTGPDGRFDFAGIKHGSQTVRVYPPRHLEPEPIAFPLNDGARLRELDVPVDPGRAVAIVVIDRQNDPVANASVFAVTESKLRARTKTDEDGRATVAVPPGEAATLFVIPEEGPFAMLRVPRSEDKGRLPVYLPRTTSSLSIRAQTTKGEALPPFSLLMRYNGELVPPEIADELQALQGLRLATGDDSEAHLQNIPSGSYEFWPYRNEREAQSIMESAVALLAPIQVNVRSGENRIAVKFASRGTSPSTE